MSMNPPPAVENPGDVRLGVAIMHHPSRAAWLGPLLADLDYPATVVVDVHSQGPWPTARRAWLAVRAGATHHLVLQDDAVVAIDFVAAAVEALRHVPDEAVCFYCPRDLIPNAIGRGDHWATMDGGVWGIATALPVPWIEDWLRWDREHVRPECPHDDARLSLYLMAHHRPAWLTAPCLVANGGRHSSIIGHSPLGQQAKVVPVGSATGLSWDVPRRPLHLSMSTRSYWGAKYLREV